MRLLSWLVFVICGLLRIFYQILILYCKFIIPKALKWGMLNLCTLIFIKIFIKCFKNSILFYGSIRTSERPSYLFSLDLHFTPWIAMWQNVFWLCNKKNQFTRLFFSKIAFSTDHVQYVLNFFVHPKLKQSVWFPSVSRFVVLKVGKSQKVFSIWRHPQKTTTPN